MISVRRAGQRPIVGKRLYIAVHQDTTRARTQRILGKDYEGRSAGVSGQHGCFGRNHREVSGKRLTETRERARPTRRNERSWG